MRKRTIFILFALLVIAFRLMLGGPSVHPRGGDAAYRAGFTFGSTWLLPIVGALWVTAVIVVVVTLWRSRR